MIIIYLLRKYELYDSKGIFNRFRWLLVTAMTRERK